MSTRILIQCAGSSDERPAVLARRCADVVEFGHRTQQLVDDLVDTMTAHPIAVGLAAPQIGESLRVAVVNLKRDNEETLVLINPTIVREWGKKDKKKESCMSVPGYRGEVERRYALEVAYFDRGGVRLTMEATGFFARVIAHEVDHLDGRLYVDRMGTGVELEPVDFF